MVSNGTPDPLSEALGTAPPPAVAGLPADVRDRLATQVLAAQKAQRRAIAAATEVAIPGVPLPVRGVVRKALLG